MARKAKRLFTIGYEQTPPKAVLDELEKAGVNETVFPGGKHMRPDIDLISGRIDDQLRGAAT